MITESGSADPSSVGEFGSWVSTLGPAPTLSRGGGVSNAGDAHDPNQNLKGFLISLPVFLKNEVTRDSFLGVADGSLAMRN